MKHLRIEPCTKDAEQMVIELWIACNLTRPWNDPMGDIQRKDDPVMVLSKRLLNDGQ